MAKKSSKTRKKRKTKRRNNGKHELLGVVIIGLGCFSLLSVYTPSTAGIAGIYFDQVLRGLFGIVAYIIPFLIVITGILTIMAYYKKVNKAKLGLTLSAIILILLLIHLFHIKQFNKTRLWDFVLDSYDWGIEGWGSGALFSPLIYYIYKWFGTLGSYLFLITLFIVVILMLTNLSLKQLGIDFYDKIKVNGKKSSARIQKAVNARKKSKKKAFVGEIVDFDDQSHESNNPQYLKDAFKEKRKKGKINKLEKDIKIVEYNRENNGEGVSSGKEEPMIDNLGKEGLSDDCISEKDEKIISYSFPPINLLKLPYNKKQLSYGSDKIKKNAEILEETLDNFGVSAKVLQISRGPTITRYELQPAPGIKVSRIVNLSDDIALSLAASGVRIEAPIPGKAAIGVEVPNRDVSIVSLREVLESRSFKDYSGNLCFALGKDIAGKAIIADIEKMPHLLIAGATGSGKSVCINGLIVSLLYKSSPEKVKLILIDPKRVELNHFNGIPHLLIPVVTDIKKAAGALNWAVQEMENRYKTFAEEGVKDLDSYNRALAERGEEKLPQIVVIVDELADLMMVAPKEVEDAICRLAQMARAAGIHLVIATQRPSVDVITGLIKANIPSRIAFFVSSHTDSRTILDMGGAEKLVGRGDMLYYPVGASKPVRVQGSYVSEKEIVKVVKHIKSSYETPKYDMEVIEEIATEKEEGSEDCDELFSEAIEIVLDAGQASISMLQRRLRIGYARAARMIDEMEVRGYVSGFDGSRPRNVLITREDFEEIYGE